MPLLGLFYGLSDRRVGGDASHIEELVGTESQEVGEVRVQTRHAALDPVIQQQVEPAASPEGAVDEFLGPPPVARVEGADALVEGCVQHHVLPQVGKNAGGDDTGVGDLKTGGRGGHYL